MKETLRMRKKIRIWSELLELHCAVGAAVAPRAMRMMDFAVCLRGGGPARRAHLCSLKIRVT